MLTCARAGRGGVDWRTIAGSSPLDVLRAAGTLAGGGAHLGCGEDGFSAVFHHPATPIGERWGAFLGLQGILAADGRTSDLTVLIDSAMAHGLDLADQLYLLDALAGVGVESQARATAASMVGDRVASAPSFALWLAGEWHARNGDRAGLNTLREALAARAVDNPDPRIERYATALEARSVLLQGDTAGAIGRLRAAFGTAPRVGLDWGVGESLAPDRLLLAQLLLTRGQPREAISAAAIFDHPAPVAFLPYLPASLTLRRQAALTLGQQSEAGRYESRLAALGKQHPPGSASPSSTPEAP